MIARTLAFGIATIVLMALVEGFVATANNRKRQTGSVVLAGMLGVAFLIALLYAGGEL